MRTPGPKGEATRDGFGLAPDECDITRETIEGDNPPNASGQPPAGRDTKRARVAH